jgi:anti-sigma B factor antagonist
MSSPVDERRLDDDRIGISIARCAGVDIVSVSGEFDAFSAQLVRRRVASRAKINQPQVIVDLSHVTFMDAGAVGTIVYCRRMLAVRGADLALVCPGGPALRLMTLLGLDRVWTLYSTLEEALQAVVVSQRPAGQSTC